jgi:hypothetical protein
MLPHVWNLRSKRCFSRLLECFFRGRERFGFRLIHFSVQGNHLHLLVEAQDEKSLARGMQGLGVRIAKAPEEAARRGGLLRDPFSSAWRGEGTDPPTVSARTWLLSAGWRKCAGAKLLLLVDGTGAPVRTAA